MQNEERMKLLETKVRKMKIRLSMIEGLFYGYFVVSILLLTLFR
jgi:cell division protein FtsL